MIPIFGTLTLFAFGITALLVLTALVPSGRAALGEVGSNARGPIGFALFVALTATLGSLYLSEIRQLEPCMLCWFQRIAMYPLVIVLGVGFLRGDREVWKTVLPLTVIGAFIAAYHIAVQWMPSMEVTQCSASAPCSVRYFLIHGFISIPVMAGAAFLLITAVMVVLARGGRGGDGPDEALDPID